MRKFNEKFFRFPFLLAFRNSFSPLSRLYQGISGILFVFFCSLILCEPVSAKTLFWQYYEPVGNPNPASDGTDASIVFSNMIHDALIGYDENGEAIPWLAEEIHSNEDFTQWTFKLHDNAHFSDGTPIHADAVLYTINFYKNSSVLAGTYALIGKAEAEDDLTVTVDLTAPEKDFLYQDPIYILSPSCGSYGCDYRQPNMPVSGAWYVSEYTPAYHAVLKKNDGYWMSGFPKFDQVDYLFSEDGLKMMDAVKEGERDFAPLVPAAAARYENADGVRLIRITEQDSYEGFAFNLAVPPFNTKEVRTALKMLTNPEEMSEMCWNGYAENTGGDYLLSEEKSSSSSDLSPEERIRKAREQLASSGWTDQDGDGILESHGVAGLADNTKFSFPLAYESDRSDAECHAVLMAGWAKQAGIDLIPTPDSRRTFYADTAAGKYPIWEYRHALSTHPLTAFFKQFDSAGSAVGYGTHVSDAQLDQMIGNALQLTDEDQRREQISGINDYLASQQILIADTAPLNGWLLNSQMIHFYASPLSLMGTRSIILADISGR